MNLNPKFIEADFNMGQVYYQLEDDNNAYKYFSVAIIKEQMYAEAYHFRGIVNYRKGNLIEAIFDFTKAIEIDMTYAESYFYRGLVYADQKDYKAAFLLH